jgi:hypothetical protein
MIVDVGSSSIIDGANRYELHANTDTHFDVFLEREVVAELGYLPGCLFPETGASCLPPQTLRDLAEAWGRHLRSLGLI